jgi:hypothetical protein
VAGKGLGTSMKKIAVPEEGLETLFGFTTKT